MDFVFGLHQPNSILKAVGFLVQKGVTGASQSNGAAYLLWFWKRWVLIAVPVLVGILLLVNPFDVGETAAAIRRAVDMPREQRRKRMQLMRRTVKENNVYRWAGRMLMDASRIRQRQALLTGEEELRLT